MTEKILVFKGEDVLYIPHQKKIACISGDDCFVITDVPPDTVIGEEADTSLHFHGYPILAGTELWSDGEKWIIKE